MGGYWEYDYYCPFERKVLNRWHDASGKVHETQLVRVLGPNEVFVPPPPKQHPVLESQARAAAIFKAVTDAQRPSLDAIHEHLLGSDSYLNEAAKREMREQIQSDRIRRNRNA